MTLRLTVWCFSSTGVAAITTSPKLAISIGLFQGLIENPRHVMGVQSTQGTRFKTRCMTWWAASAGPRLVLGPLLGPHRYGLPRHRMPLKLVSCNEGL